jgi:ureidoglycolate lyase
MSPAPFRLAAQALDEASFAPFGEIIGPRSRPPVTNRDLLARGLVRIEHPVPEDRIADFDVLDYWAPVAEISAETMKLGFLRPRMRALEVGWFERHLRGTQSFLPLGGGRSLFVLVPPNDPFDSPAPPRLEDARAFVLDGTVGINLKLGTWHWTPFPLTEGASFAILVRRDAAADDLNMIDLLATHGRTIAVDLA